MILDRHGKEVLDRVKIYLISLDWKIKRAQYHSDRVDEYWKTLMDGLTRWPIISNPYFIEAEYCSAFEMEAMIQTLHSIGDILAQSINASLPYKSSKKEDNVALSRIIKNIPKTSPLSDSLQALINSPEYFYFNAFSNLTKHTNRIDVGYSVYTANRRTEGKTGFLFKGFKYREKAFKEISFDVIRNNYRNDFIEKIRRVGIELNKHLKEMR